MIRVARCLAWCIFVGLLASCASQLPPSSSKALPEATFGPPPEYCEIPPDAPLAFVGRTTLSDIGLTADQEHRDLPGVVYVSLRPIIRPWPATKAPPQRVYCLVRIDDGVSFLPGDVPDDWALPASIP